MQYPNNFTDFCNYWCKHMNYDKNNPKDVKRLKARFLQGIIGDVTDDMLFGDPFHGQGEVIEMITGTYEYLLYTNYKNIDNEHSLEKVCIMLRDFIISPEYTDTMLNMINALQLSLDQVNEDGWYLRSLSMIRGLLTYKFKDQYIRYCDAALSKVLQILYRTIEPGLFKPEHPVYTSLPEQI